MKYPDSWLYPIFCCCTNSNPAKKISILRLYHIYIIYIYVYIYIYISDISDISDISYPHVLSNNFENSVLLLLLCFPQGSVCFLLSIFHGLLPSLPPRTGAHSRPKDQGLRRPKGRKMSKGDTITRDTHGTTSLWPVRSINMYIIFYFFIMSLYKHVVLEHVYFMC